MRAIRAASPAPVEAFGVGGPALAAEGLRTVVDAQELMVMGSTEVLARLPKILKALDQVVAAVKSERPDVVVVMDYPDFHLRLARRLRGLGIPLIDYIPPKVWVWRQGRVKKLKALFDRVLCIFPSEEEFFKRHQVPAHYVGNPLLDELPFDLTRENARSQLGLHPTEQVLVLMPGSRPTELRLMLELMLDSADQAAGKLGQKRSLVVLLPFAATADLAQLQVRVDEWKNSRGSHLKIALSQGNAHQCLVAADAALIKSGTSTLEAALLGCPHSITYRFSALSTFIFRHLVRYRGPVGLSNIVAGCRAGEPFLVHEVILKDATVSRLTDEIVGLFTDQVYRAQMKEGFARLRKVLAGPGDGPSAEAARLILEAAAEGKAGK